MSSEHEIAERSVPLPGPLSVTPLYAAGDEIVWWDGHSWNELAGGTSAGAINVTGDVLGTGTSSIPTTVLALQHRAVSSTAPLDGQVLGWSASAGQWHPVPAAVVTGGGSPPGGAVGTIQINAGAGNFGGITIGGDATLNYSTGALTLAPSGLTAGVYQGITFDAKGRAITAINMNYAPLADPHFTGVPTAPTAPAGTSSTQLATTAYVDSLYSPGAYLENAGTSVTLSDGVAVNLASVNLAAGDWIINGSAYFNTGTALNYNFMAGANTTSATLPGIPYYTQLSPAGSVAGGAWTLNIPERKYSFTVPTTVYLVVRAGFGAGATVTAQGQIAAEQMQKLIATGTGGGGPIMLAGDVSGAAATTTVIGLQGRPVANTLPTDTQVLAWSSGAWRPTAAGTGGGGGTPGPSNTYVQYNASGAFAGSSGATFSATQLTSLAMGLGSDALGDIYFRNVTGHLQALPAGGPGFLLQMQGGVPTWQSVATGAGTVNPGAAPQIAQYTGSNIVGGVTMSGDATIAVGGAMTLRSIGTAGSYNNVTTDAAGRVIAGSNVAYLTANQLITLTGDNTGSGTGTFTTVTVGLQGRPVASTLPNNNEVLAWNTTNGRWQPTIAATGGGITSIIFATPLTGGTISTSGQTVGLAVPSANLLGGTGTNFTSVTVGTGLLLSGGNLTATASGGNVTAGTLTTSALTVGTGPQAIASLASTGSTTTVLHGNAAGLPTFGVVNLATDVGTSQLQIASLGNGTGANNTTFWRGDGVWAAPSGSGSGTVVASLQFQMPYYATAGSVASVQGHPAITTTTGGSLSINTAAGAHVPPVLTTTQLQLVGEGGGNPNLEITGFGGAPGFIVQRSSGTQTTPTATSTSATAVLLLNLSGRGYGTAGWTSSRVAMQFYTAEAWNVGPTQQGTGIAFLTTPIGSATQFGCVDIRSGVMVNSLSANPGGGDMGAGTINVATGYYVNGNLLGADTTATLAASAVNPAITTQFAIVTPVAAGHGVTLPTGSVGGHCIVRNSGANTLNVLPIGTAQINTLGNGVAITILPNSTAYFEAQSATQWFTVP